MPPDVLALPLDLARARLNAAGFPIRLEWTRAASRRFPTDENRPYVVRQRREDNTNLVVLTCALALRKEV